MKPLLRQTLVSFLTVLLCISLFPLDAVFAQRGGRGGGRSGGGGYRSGGASPRVNSSTSLQNRGNFSSSEQTRQGNFQQNQQSRQSSYQQNRQSNQQNRQSNQETRQTDRDQYQQNRQSNQETRQTTSQQNQQNRQTDRDQYQQNRQSNQENRQTTSQENQQNRQEYSQQNQQNRQDFVDDNYYGGGWHGGGYYAPPGWGAWAATAGFATGVALGATVSSPPPYYNNVSVGTTSYLYSDGVYLQPQGSSYVVVAPPSGAVVSYLPDECTTTQSNGNQYFNCNGIYYQTFYQNGTTVYKVVKL